MVRNEGSNKTDNRARDKRLINGSHGFLHQISGYANLNLPRVDFLRKLSEMLVDFSKCDEIVLWVKDDEEENSYTVTRHTKSKFYYTITSPNQNFDSKIINDINDDPDLNQLCSAVIKGSFAPSLPCFTGRGSFWTGALNNRKTNTRTKEADVEYRFNINKFYRSIVIIPITVGGKKIGLLQLKKRNAGFFTGSAIEFYEDFVQTIGLILMNQQAQAALCERIKELTCLYDIARTFEQPDISLDEIYQHTVELLPPAWQYPEIAHARIRLDERVYLTDGFKENQYKQTADIIVNGKKRGCIEVIYEKQMIELYEGPFLKEERRLIDNIARDLALITERKEEHENRERLSKQLRHADRLATIGQLAAGVAHEINEPLSAILGFAQLAGKNSEISQSTKQDIKRIENATLHAREIVRKLLIFARQMPTQKIRINLNEIVKEGLYFLESRCAKEGIDIKYSLDSNIPGIKADPAQMTQVLVNLAVNSIQSMKNGGTIYIQTCALDNYILLIVKDTGEGINEENIKKIFLPFFTTKEVNEGTGLGLAVVHGIITAHEGTISVDSKAGYGSTFEIKLSVS